LKCKKIGTSFANLTYTRLATFPSRKISGDFGLSKKHRIPLRKIKCMTKECYQKLRKAWMGRV
jgi:hypothetical protein